jgi:hypothetical protein
MLSRNVCNYQPTLRNILEEQMIHVSLYFSKSGLLCTRKKEKLYAEFEEQNSHTKNTCVYGKIVPSQIDYILTFYIKSYIVSHGLKMINYYAS